LLAAHGRQLGARGVAVPPQARGVVARVRDDDVGAAPRAEVVDQRAHVVEQPPRLQRHAGHGHDVDGAPAQQRHQRRHAVAVAAVAAAAQRVGREGVARAAQLVDVHHAQRAARRRVEAAAGHDDDARARPRRLHVDARLQRAAARVAHNGGGVGAQALRRLAPHQRQHRARGLQHGVGAHGVPRSRRVVHGVRPRVRADLPRHHQRRPLGVRRKGRVVAAAAARVEAVLARQRERHAHQPVVGRARDGQELRRPGKRRRRLLPQELERERRVLRVSDLAQPALRRAHHHARVRLAVRAHVAPHVRVHRQLRRERRHARAQRQLGRAEPRQLARRVQGLRVGRAVGHGVAPGRGDVLAHLPRADAHERHQPRGAVALGLLPRPHGAAALRALCRRRLRKRAHRPPVPRLQPLDDVADVLDAVGRREKVADVHRVR
ncbi:hypothetical protein GGI18_002338, partial [Coemansia linderi]